MQIKCNYCGALIDEASEVCPQCGAPLSGEHRTAKEQPKTIEELKAWYEAHHLPPEEITRFFIGKNVTEPKAFGIYKDGNGDCVVYKNKANGERAVRYKGVDEQYAVNELLQRLKAEIVDQKGGQRPANVTQRPQKKSRKGMGCAIVILAVMIIGILAAIFDHSAPNGYYRYQGQEYYHQGSRWYYYDANTDDWYEYSDGDRLNEEITDETADEYSFDNHTGRSFEDSQWYDSGSNNDDGDWDSDSDWDSGDSWDSNDTDWDSDW